MKKMNKLVAVAVAGALTAPAAMAAQDTSGMQYTSAAEGFYASIRVRYNSGSGDEDDGGDVGNSSSRIGVRGTNDLGGGLEGFYQWEGGVDTANGGSVGTRVGQVGLRGAFGELRTGSMWTNSYNWTYGSTDVANVGSGNLVYNNLLPGRSSNTIQYTTPDLNGFQASIGAQMDNARDGEGSVGAEAWVVATVAGTNVTYDVKDTVKQKNLPDGVKRTAKLGDTIYTFLDADNDGTLDTGEHVFVDVNPVDDNDVDHYSIAAKYGMGGLSVGVAYNVVPDGQAGGTEDLSAWVAKLGYSQDNWYVNGWYSKDNATDGGAADDTVIVSLAGGVSVDKVNLYLLHESQDDGADDVYSTFGVQYNLGSKSRVWFEYQARDLDSETTEEDNFNMGLRHDF